MIMSVYIAEISPKESRGMLNSVNGIAYCFGIISSLAANVGFSRFFLGWRLAIITSMFPILIYTFGMIMWMPYTPQ